MDTLQKLSLLADDSRYDISCACATSKEEHRVRRPDGLWLYPVALPNGGKSIMLKTLLSNACVNNCLYCPHRATRDTPRCALEPETIASVFMDYVRRNSVFGLFLSSGVLGTPDATMERLSAVAATLRRRHAFRGYIHLKVIPGASDAAIREALSLASAVSLNVEAPTRAAFAKMSRDKNYDKDIVSPIRRLSELTAPGTPFAHKKITTQFIVGASDEKDTEIVKATFGLYRRLRLSRVYFSAYQRGAGDPSLPGEQNSPARPGDTLTREHRLYQADWLIRKYGFSDAEIPFGPDGNLSLETDPKTLWAKQHPERFPMDINKADRDELLRVPGLGPVTVNRILESRAGGNRIRHLTDLGRMGKRLQTAGEYITFG
ncbi:MAG: radical SAM protein [Planctomycetota bacterium]